MVRGLHSQCSHVMCVGIVGLTTDSANRLLAALVSLASLSTEYIISEEPGHTKHYVCLNRQLQRPARPQKKVLGMLMGRFASMR